MNLPSFSITTKNQLRRLFTCDGEVAWTARKDLAEATAKIIMHDTSEYDNKTVILTGATATLTDIASIISEVRGKPLPARFVSLEEYMKALAEEMGDLVAELFTSEFVGLKKGDMGVVDPTLENILGRTLKSIADVVKETFLNMRGSY